jgi:hypothetical protein
LLQHPYNIVTTALQHRYNVVTTSLQHRYNIVTTSLQHCCNILTTLLQRHYNIVTMSLQHCYNIVTTLLQHHNNVVTTSIQHCYNIITTLLQRPYNLVTTSLQRHYSIVTTLLQRCYNIDTMLLQHRYNIITTLWVCPKGCRILATVFRPEWPDWANFRLLGEYLLRDVNLKNDRKSRNFGLLSSTVKTTGLMLKIKMGWATFWVFTNSSGHPDSGFYVQMYAEIVLTSSRWANWKAGEQMLRS